MSYCRLCGHSDLYVYKSVHGGFVIIGGPYSQPGEVSTPGETADILEAIRAEGFQVPQYAIDALREEQAKE